jgi:hypothetical protein
VKLLLFSDLHHDLAAARRLAGLAAAPLTFTLVARNARGVEQSLPLAEKFVNVRLLYSPAVISRQGAQVPQAKRKTDWVELKSKPGATFTVEKGRVLAPAGERKLATFDLRARFDVSKPGFYRLQLLPVSADPKATKEFGEVRFSLAAPRKPTADPKR